MRRFLKVILVIGIFATAAVETTAQERTRPDPAIPPDAVVGLQLRALQANDRPFPDAGIQRVWAFAHPDNKRMTGPLPRFTAMIKGPGYRPLINHRHHQIQRLAASADLAVFAVRVTAADGRVYLYQWQVAPVRAGAAAGAWMTTGVSPPVSDGEET